MISGSIIYHAYYCEASHLCDESSYYWSKNNTLIIIFHLFMQWLKKNYVANLEIWVFKWIILNSLLINFKSTWLYVNFDLKKMNEFKENYESSSPELNESLEIFIQKRITHHGS